MSQRDKLLDQLWTLLAEDLITRIEHGDTKEKEEGSVMKISASPALLAVAAKFLKDNQVAAPIGNEATNKLADLLKKAEADLHDEVNLQ